MHPTILHIETSTNVCSVALSYGSECIFFKSDNEGMNHAALLSVFIEQALEALKSHSKSLDAVSVSSGPGSYTGLRIGVSTAKGICYGLDIPLIAIDSLEILTVPVIKEINKQEANTTLLCPMIDARRMEVYDALYRLDRSIFRNVEADIIDEDSFSDALTNNKVYFFGNGADKCKTMISHQNAIFVDSIEPLAKNMVDMAVKKYSENDFVDTAYFEPFYLKEFQTTVSKKPLF
ncbi:tRNA (adenosine(37)-N6)-threonylcarbamoyltransferase complex dimerization subunit type 1 TsaB [Paludibacter sp. 221]|uniref:tRNA (adenosine(37)-N6)-threonylcarbamoyltransferase complex dimerization subunit type 1 TsaB n=1 Tax=Paludibacter sp. 221 TaxID=2302939 RepID=UPI0013D614DE|nr:tRNA (adenosine(37)-N6)-threonylcarbamoyltransferase complex dimerization subunit type 1 TsaB [Paludibacter sp. 221]NDV46017.1 tRNA (adenosine(37)-N6)-threonylcarbamoyltransferase complex dimerization subunit type 1 TsaB [Paludibacter sp. 221]